MKLSKDDLIIDLKANDGSESFLGNDLIVSLDTTISDSLRLEGVLRDLIRQIQLMRKEANFEIDDRIIISANFSDELKNIIEDCGIVCPISGTKNWTDVKQFNLMFKTQLGSTESNSTDLFFKA